MSEYDIDFSENWDEYFCRLDKSIQRRIAKKILQLRFETHARKLRAGVPFYVAEVGQYRIQHRF